MDRHVDKAAKAKLEPTTAESLAARKGVAAIDYCYRAVSQRQWTGDGATSSSAWSYAAGQSVLMAETLEATKMLTRINDDAQTIRVLVDGDDALVVVYTSECTYHKSMARAMRRVLRLLKEQRKTDEVDAFVGSCSEMGGYDQDDEDDRPRGCA